jgi:hypothetical protein
MHWQNQHAGDHPLASINGRFAPDELPASSNRE